MTFLNMIQRIHCARETQDQMERFEPFDLEHFRSTRNELVFPLTGEPEVRIDVCISKRFSSSFRGYAIATRQR